MLGRGESVMNRTELYVMKPSMKDEMETEERKNGNEETYQTYHHRIGNHTLSCITRIEDAAAVGTGRREADKMYGWRYNPMAKKQADIHVMPSAAQKRSVWNMKKKRPISMEEI